MVDVNARDLFTKPRRVGGSDDLAHQVASLSALDAETLRQRWKVLFGADPSPNLGRSFLVHALAYRLQEKALGGLKHSTRRVLDRVADGTASDEPKRARARKAGAGTVLIREWGGVRHRVTVLDDDVVYRGHRYKSLSEVARTITGTHWSGPLFFGLTRRGNEAGRG